MIASRAVKRALLLGSIAVLLGPNLAWTNWSTVRIENRGAQPIDDVVVHACGESTSLGPLPAGSSRFRFLPKCGDDSLEIGSNLVSICTLYVEGEMYHVRAWFSSPTDGDCAYGGMPPFSPLFLAELL